MFEWTKKKWLELDSNLQLPGYCTGGSAKLSYLFGFHENKQS